MIETECPNCKFTEPLARTSSDTHSCDHCGEVYPVEWPAAEPESINPYHAPTAASPAVAAVAAASTATTAAEPSAGRQSAPELVDASGPELCALIGEESLPAFVQWLPAPYGNHPPIRSFYSFGSAPYAPIWFGYRRMHSQAFLCYLRALGAGIVYALGFTLFDMLSDSIRMSWGVGFITGFACYLGPDRRYLYALHISKTLRKTRMAVDPQSPQYLDLLRRQGGTSQIAGLAHGALYVTILIALLYVTVLARYMR